MAVLDFVNNISNAIDNGMYTIGIFMDLSKAFDTMDHNILLNKLSHCGFRGNSQEWFRNYLESNLFHITKYHHKLKRSSVVYPKAQSLGHISSFYI